MTWQNDRITSIPAPEPVDYDRQYNFLDWETQHPALPKPAAGLEAEFNAIQQALDETQARARLIQRSDGALANQSVGVDQLKPDVQIGVNPPNAWAAFTSYTVRDSVVFDNQAWYVCLESHTSTADFATDLAAGKWQLIFDFNDLLTTEVELLVAQAEAAATAAEAAASSLNLPTLASGDEGKLLVVNPTYDGYDLLASIGTTQLANSAVTTAKIADANVTTAKIADGAITADKLEAGASARTTAVTYTVGPTGDYASISAALADLTKKFPAYASTPVRVTLDLEAAFSLAEQVVVDGLDLGWVTITAGSTITITRSALTVATYSTDIYAALAGKNGATLPVVDATFSMDTSGTATGRVGLSVTGASRAVVTLNGGFTNAPKYNLHVVANGHVDAADANFSGPTTAPEYNVYLRDCATADLGSADLSDGTTGSVALFDGARAELAGADVSGTGGTGVSANRGSSANCYTVTSTGRTTSFSVSAGSIISANLSGGTLSQTANTVAAAGIIFQ